MSQLGFERQSIREGARMAAKSAALAKEFDAKAEDAMATLQKLSDADWRNVTEAEKWSVGVTAHHLAGVLEPISHMIKAVVSGQARGTLTAAMIDEMNAQHARDYVHCTKAETIELLRNGAAVASATIRGLNDDQLAKSGTVVTDAPPMTAAQLITSGLIAHIDEHFDSIRKTVGLTA
jgi:Mycothiol maleylpyruvate isomerase N-terminal domain